MWFGCSGAVASAVTTAATVGAYAVAGTIGAIAVSDSIEIATSDESGYGYNPIRDSVMGGNQEAYDTLKVATDIVADCIVEVGTSNYYDPKTVSNHTETTADVQNATKTASKPYANHRPSYAQGQVEAVWENAKDMDGKVWDPSGVEIVWDKSKSRNGQWDMGYIPGEKYSEMHSQYMNDLISKEEFLAWYRNPDNYRPELPSTNRSHRYESIY